MEMNRCRRVHVWSTFNKKSCVRLHAEPGKLLGMETKNELGGQPQTTMIRALTHETDPKGTGHENLSLGHDLVHPGKL